MVRVERMLHLSNQKGDIRPVGRHTKSLSMIRSEIKISHKIIELARWKGDHSKMQANSRLPCNKMMYGTNLQVIGAESATPFLDNMSLIKNQIDNVVYK